MKILTHLIQFAADTKIQISANDLGLTGAKGNIGAGEVTTALNAVYFLAGIVAVVVIIIGGIRYTTSNGDANQIKAGKDTIQYAVIGLVVIIMAAAITTFIGSRI